MLKMNTKEYIKNTNDVDKLKRIIIGIIEDYDYDNDISEFIHGNYIGEDMNLKQYLENELDVDFIEDGRVMCDDEVMDFCNYYDIYYYDKKDFQDELRVYQECDARLFDFIGDWKGLAEYFNYSMINNNLFIDTVTVFVFKKLLVDDFEGDINLAIKQWRESL